MTNIQPQQKDLAQNRLGLCFSVAASERAYRQWRNEQNMPVFRLTTTVSLIAWLLSPLPGYLWRPDINWIEIWWIGYVVIAPMMAFALPLSYTRLARGSAVAGGLGLCLSGCAVLWIAFIEMAKIPGTELGFGIAITINFASFALFMRLPPAIAALSVAPFMLLALTVVTERFLSGTLSGVNAYAYTTTVGLSFFFVCVMSVVGERFFRRAFVAEQLLLHDKAALEHSRGVIRRYVPPALVEQIIDGNLAGNDIPQRRRVTILFCDVVGFTQIADRVEPEVMSQVIGEYMAAMSQVVDDHRGTVNEFVGDGLMALFGAPAELEPEVQARSAVEAAQAMQAKIPELNGRWRKLGLGAALQLRIGINTGMVSVGSYGSQGRMTYTAIGMQTNIAARIQSHCEPSEILISEATWQLINEVMDCNPRGEVECKGIHYPVKVYSP